MKPIDVKTIRNLIQAAKNSAFALESAANLRGMERQLLPFALQLREAIYDAEQIGELAKPWDE